MRPILAPTPSGPIEPVPVPSFSVIIASYQAAGFIGETVASALDQTVPAHEVIVCDDASTDDIESALAPYLDRIVFLRRERNGGEGAAKNTAARAATGDFVAVLDHDNQYLPEWIEAVGDAAAARPDLDIIHTDAYIELEGQVVRRAFGADLTFEVTDQRRAILEANYILANTAVRRETLLSAGGFDESVLYGDWDRWLRLIFSGSKAGMVNEPLLRFRIHEGAMSSNPLVMVRGEVETLEKAIRGLDMTPVEHAVLAHTLEREQRALALEESHDALRNRAPDARRRSLGIALGRGYGPGTRIKAALAAAAPGIARRRLAAQARRGWSAAFGVQVRRDG